MSTPETIGAVAGIWRYPVKSFQGEALISARLTRAGLAGDRAFALIDRGDGKAASAKNPRKWPGLLHCHARFVEEEVVEMTLPDGRRLRSDAEGIDAILSEVWGRPVSLSRSPKEGALIEAVWPEITGLAASGTTEETLGTGSFHDLAPLHLVTTATLRRLQKLAPSCHFDVRRFRPNLLIDTGPDVNGFVEDSWIGKTLTIGSIQVRVTAPCSRCVMTTLDQPELPAEIDLLRSVVAHHQGHVGVYGVPLQGEELLVGDPVRFE